MPQVKNKLHFQVLEIIVILCQQLFYECIIKEQSEVQQPKCNDIKSMANFTPFDQIYSFIKMPWGAFTYDIRFLGR